MKRMMPAIEETLIKRNGLPSGFYFYQSAWDNAFEFMTLTGRDDQANKRSRKLSFTIRRADIQLLEKEWERETGKCSQCTGRGNRAVGASVETGVRYETCKPCNGTGAAVSQ